MDLVAFNILAVIVTIAALGVIISRNPVHSVLCLILAFFTSAGLLVLIGAEFLAMLLVVVYVGAVAVLMVAGGILFGELALIGFARGGDTPGSFDPAPGAETNAEAIGAVMYTDYLLLFQLAGIILLLAMIGAIVLTLKHKAGVKRQNISQQNARTREGAFELIDVEPGKGI